jgi:hypothetical protein
VESRKRDRRGTPASRVAAPASAAECLSLANIAELIDSGGQITLGTLYPITGVAAVANDEHNSLAMLRRGPGETLPRLLQRLDAAIALAWTANQVTDEINTAPPRPKQR